MNKTLQHSFPRGCAYAIALIVLSAIALPALSTPVPKVLGKTGPTRSIAPYYETITGSDSRPPPLDKATSGKTTPDQVTLAKFFSKALLPIRTPEMTPGPVAARAVDAKMLDRPFFILGSDRRSQAWLASHRDRLIQLQAVGLLVQAETAADLRAIADLGVGIRIAPVPGSDLATRLGLKHYPVLISSGWVEQ